MNLNKIIRFSEISFEIITNSICYSYSILQCFDPSILYIPIAEVIPPALEDQKNLGAIVSSCQQSKLWDMIILITSKRDTNHDKQYMSIFCHIM